MNLIWLQWDFSQEGVKGELCAEWIRREWGVFTLCSTDHLCVFIRPEPWKQRYSAHQELSPQHRRCHHQFHYLFLWHSQRKWRYYIFHEFIFLYNTYLVLSLVHIPNEQLHNTNCHRECVDPDRLVFYVNLLVCYQRWGIIWWSMVMEWRTLHLLCRTVTPSCRFGLRGSLSAVLKRTLL